jgi:hypothetical protein
VTTAVEAAASVPLFVHADERVVVRGREPLELLESAFLGAGQHRRHLFADVGEFDGLGAGTAAYELTADHFDCNHRLVTMRVDGNGSVESGMLTTAMGCG